MANRNYPKVVAATTTIPFDNPVTAIPPKTITGSTTFSKNTTGAQVGYGAVVRVTANGSNVPDLSAFKKIGTGSYDNTNGVVNQLWFVYDGVDYCVSITQPVAISGGGGGGDTTPPTVVSAELIDSTHMRIIFSETVVPTGAGFTVTNTTTTINYTSWGTPTGSGTTWTFPLTSGAMLASNPHTLAYDSSTGNTLDTSGNELVSFSGTSVTNSIEPSVTMSDITFNPKTSALVNSTGTEWQNSGATHAAYGVAQGLSAGASESVAIIQAKYLNSLVDTGGISIDDNNTNDYYTADPTGAATSVHKAVLRPYGNTLYICEEGSAIVTTGVSIAYTEFFRIKAHKSGGTWSFIAQKSADGTTWTDVYTYTTTATGTIYLKGHIVVSSAYLVDPKGGVA